MAFTDQGHLTRHRTVHTGERPYECAECGASFTQKGDVVRHARTHLGDRAYSCHLCRYQASESGNVKKHVIAVHSKEYPYMCERCGKGFVTPSMLRAHLAAHVEHRHRCSLCPFSSNDKDRVLKHEKIHKGARPFACGTCGKTFKWHYDLAEHRRLHTGERLHVCSECGMSFTKRGDLVRHARTHTGDKPYSCHLCKYRTGDSGSVKKHVIQVHTKEFPHTCGHCGKGMIRFV
ncbi:zinc finger, C2H2 type, putative [Ixodes scapularis]|uniref:Zinc finger, C2H2 type, putative n=1 Tax=Ixodes scapularis TaxID=6945 RepID=B7P0V6_IXOSC|nr:zinc finger, C2H2 type, putative [Ixodes scapularis]|eukprot:XP_002399382.1 zinc finger, C2H2 type, putative [Ixodes scapularis]